jgi:hypothetical protein
MFWTLRAAGGYVLLLKEIALDLGVLQLFKVAFCVVVVWALGFGNKRKKSNASGRRPNTS